jgi:peptide/nickel transport system substrate-binding protein
MKRGIETGHLGSRDSMSAVGRRILYLALAAILVACAGPDVTPTAGEGTGEPATGEPATGEPATGEPATPKQLVIASFQDITDIDPAVGYIGSISNGAALYALYDPLFMQVGDPPELTPVLAESIEGSADGLEWTIRMNPDARFQDGSAVTSEAVKFSFERMLRINRGASFMWTGIVDPEAIETPDELTVRIPLLRPFAAFPSTLPALLISNPEVVQANAGDDDALSWLAENSAGSGPFRMTRREPGVLYEFEADPDYWRGWPSEGRLSGVLWRIFPDASAAKIALQAGEVHTWTNIPPQDVEEIDADPNIRVEVNPGNTVHRIIMHNQSPNEYTADPNVRRALTHAFNKEAVLEAYAGYARAIKGPIPEGFHAANPDLDELEYDLDLAREALAASPWPDGGFEIEFFYPDIELARTIGLILLEGAAELNIDVRLEAATVANFTERRSDPATMADTMNQWFGPQYLDADGYLFFQYHSSNMGNGNYTYLDSPEVDELLNEARQTTDEDERIAIYHEVQQLLVDQAVDIFTVVEDSLIPFREEVQGHVFSPARGRVPHWHDLWIADE